jgi:hypothetical protein
MSKEVMVSLRFGAVPLQRKRNRQAGPSMIFVPWRESMTDEPIEIKKPRRVELTERDLTTLSFIGEQYAARLDQIQRLLGSQAGPGAQTPGMLSESAARVWVSRMKAIEAIEMEKPYRAQPGYLISGYGLRVCVWWSWTLNT